MQRPNNPLAPWEFTTVNEKPTSSYASIKINFYPEKSFEKSFNAWIIKSDLKQYFGTYKGIVSTNEHVFEVELRGILEDHHSRW